MSISPGRTFFQGKPIYPLTYFHGGFIPPVSSTLLRIKRFEKQGHRMFPFQSLIHSPSISWSMTRCYLFFLFFFTSPIFSSFLRSLFLPLYLSSSRQIFSSFKFAETRIDRQFAKIQFSMGLKLGCSRGERKSAREKKIYKKIYSSTRSEITTSLPKSIK